MQLANLLSNLLSGGVNVRRETEAIIIRLNRGQRDKLKRRATLDKMTMQAFVESLIETAIVTKPTKRKYEKKEK